MFIGCYNMSWMQDCWIMVMASRYGSKACHKQNLVQKMITCELVQKMITCELAQKIINREWSNLAMGFHENNGNDEEMM